MFKCRNTTISNGRKAGVTACPCYTVECPFCTVLVCCSRNRICFCRFRAGRGRYGQAGISGKCHGIQIRHIGKTGTPIVSNITTTSSASDFFVQDCFISGICCSMLFYINIYTPVTIRKQVVLINFAVNIGRKTYTRSNAFPIFLGFVADIKQRNFSTFGASPVVSFCFICCFVILFAVTSITGFINSNFDVVRIRCLRRDRTRRRRNKHPRAHEHEHGHEERQTAFAGFSCFCCHKICPPFGEYLYNVTRVCAAVPSGKKLRLFSPDAL